MAKDEEKSQVKDKPTDKGPNPVALLLEWSEENRIRYALSVVLAIIGVAGSVVPYFAAGSMINGAISGSTCNGRSSRRQGTRSISCSITFRP